MERKTKRVRRGVRRALFFILSAEDAGVDVPKEASAAALSRADCQRRRDAPEGMSQERFLLQATGQAVQVQGKRNFGGSSRACRRRALTRPERASGCVSGRSGPVGALSPGSAGGGVRGRVRKAQERAARLAGGGGRGAIDVLGGKARMASF